MIISDRGTARRLVKKGWHVQSGKVKPKLRTPDGTGSSQEGHMLGESILGYSVELIIVYITSTYIYIYVYRYTDICIYIHIYIYIHTRERERVALAALRRETYSGNRFLGISRANHCVY